MNKLMFDIATASAAASYFKRYDGQLQQVCPILDLDGKKLGPRRLRTIRRNIALWEKGELRTERAPDLFCKPLAAFFPYLDPNP